MFNVLPLPKLLDDWFAWANWIATVGQAHDEAESPNGHQEFLWAVEDSPEMAWEAILTALHDPRGASHTGVLAAGPLEELLSIYGPAFIDRVEVRAKDDPPFSALLSGVWQYNISDEIWVRVQAAATSENAS